MRLEEKRGRFFFYRENDIEGVCLILHPLALEDSAEIARLRNISKNKYFFNQKFDVTVDSQREWIKHYLEKCDDIYWGICRKSDNRIVGTIRLYNIDFISGICEEGSYLIDEDYSVEAPYAIESKIMALDIAFDEFGIKCIINKNRFDNDVINRLDDKLGFGEYEDEEIGGIKYQKRVLTINDYRRKRKKLYSIVDYWRIR